MRELIGAVAVVTAAGLLYVVGGNINGNAVDAGGFTYLTFPRAMLTVIMLLGCLSGIRAIWEMWGGQSMPPAGYALPVGDETNSPQGTIRSFTGAISASGAIFVVGLASWMIPIAGFVASAVVVFVGVAAMLGYRRLSVTVPTGLALAFLIYALFTFVIRAPLPTSSWLGWI